MAWVVDTCMLIDVAEADATLGVVSAKLLDSKRTDGLTICPATWPTHSASRSTSLGRKPTAKRGVDLL
jgi:hypothetical protein